MIIDRYARPPADVLTPITSPDALSMSPDYRPPPRCHDVRDATTMRRANQQRMREKCANRASAKHGGAMRVDRTAV